MGVEIKLYNESSDRPNCSYTRVRSVAIMKQSAIINFKDQNGTQVLSNLKFKIKSEKKEKLIVAENTNDFVTFTTEIESESK